MAAIDVARKICLAVGVAVPGQLFAGTTRENMEMQALVNEAASQIVEAYDWRTLRKLATITGTGVSEEIALPTDYLRMTKTGGIRSSRTQALLSHVVSEDDWIEIASAPVGAINGSWSIFGGALHVLPIPPVGETLRFFYIRNTIVAGSKTAFTADTDVFVLDERLLALCATALWKQRKGQDFAAELADYEMALDKAKDRDAGSMPTVTGNRAARAGSVWPGRVSG